MVIVWNQCLIKSWCSWFTSSFRKICMSPSIMPCRSSFVEWLVSLVHRGSLERNIRNSSISGSNGVSPLDVVHDSLVSSISWKGWLQKDSGYSRGCGSWNFGFSMSFGEVDRLLTMVKMCSSWEEKIPTVARIWEIYSKLIIIFESILMVDGSCITHGLAHRVIIAPKIFLIF